MKVNGVGQVRTPVRSLYNPKHFAQGGGKVTVSYDPEKRVAFLLRRAIARAVADNRPLDDEAIEALRVRMLAEYEVD